MISKIVAVSLLMTANLVAMDMDNEGNRDRSAPTFVIANQGSLSLKGTEVKPRALDVHTYFPFHQLLGPDTLSQQLSNLTADEIRLENHQLAQIIDGGQPLAELTHVQSMNRAWRELELRLNSPRRDRNEKAGYMLGLAKLLMTSDFTIPERFDSPVDCYNFVLNHLHYIIASPHGITPRKVIHARIWKALMLTKLNLTIVDRTREETLQIAWDLFEEAYKQHATYSTLVFQIELIVRYGLQPHGIGQEEAFALAQELYKKINNRQYRKKCESVLERPAKKPRTDKTWHMARAAFLKDVRHELNQLQREFHSILLPPAQEIDENFLLDVEDRHQYPSDSKLESAPALHTDNPSPPHHLPEALRSVVNLTLPLAPEIVRAFDPSTGGYIFFNDYDVSGFMNNCFFNCTGLTRESALQSLIDHSDNVTVRQLVAPQILAYMIGQVPLPDLFRNNAKAVRLAQLAYQTGSLSAEQRYNEEKAKALEFCSRKDAYLAFVSYALSGTRMIDYQRSDTDDVFTSIVDALAYIHHFNLAIWTASDMDEMVQDDSLPPTLQRVHWYTSFGATRDIHLHHLRQETDGVNHFRILLPAHQPTFLDVPPASTISSEALTKHPEISSSGEKNRKRAHESIGEDSETEIDESLEDESHSKFMNLGSDEELSEPEDRDPLTLGQEIYHYYKEGKTKETIAGILKITSEDVANVLEKQYGIKKLQYSRLLTNAQKGQLRPYFKGKTSLSPKMAKSLAAKVDCTPSQVLRFFKRERVGTPAPLENNHKRAIQQLAFNKKGERNKLTNKEIAERLEIKYERRFEAYQIMNYIRTLYKTNKFNPSPF
jgi:DNA-binding CsgD family transcriptional regulator